MGSSGNINNHPNHPNGPSADKMLFSWDLGIMMNGVVVIINDSECIID